MRIPSTITGGNMSFFKKALRSITKAGVTAVKSAFIDPTINAVKSAGDIARGDSDRLLSRQGEYLKGQLQDQRAVTANILSAPGQLIGAGGLEGTSIKSSTDIKNEKNKAFTDNQNAMEAKAAADELIAAPERERQSLLSSTQKRNKLMGGGRNFGTLLGGGY